MSVFHIRTDIGCLLTTCRELLDHADCLLADGAARDAASIEHCKALVSGCIQLAQALLAENIAAGILEDIIGIAGEIASDLDQLAACVGAEIDTDCGAAAQTQATQEQLREHCDSFFEKCRSLEYYKASASMGDVYAPPELMGARLLDNDKPYPQCYADLK